MEGIRLKYIWLFNLTWTTAQVVLIRIKRFLVYCMFIIMIQCTRVWYLRNSKDNDILDQ
jgi:hypothetical protein